MSARVIPAATRGRLFRPHSGRSFVSLGDNNANTVVLLHMDGVDASTTFTNDAAGGTTAFTANGNAQVDTADSKFGGASGLFDGDGDFLGFDASGADFAWAGDFTVDAWIKTSTKTQDAGFDRSVVHFGNADGSATQFSILIDPTSGALKICGYATALVTGTTDVSAGAWTHFAAVRNGSTNKLFINGTQEGGDVTDSRSWAGKSTARVGSFITTVGDFSGWIDELRVSKGVARWTANFTPPTAAYS